MNIKNYTSHVNYESTIQRIEMRLASIGATGVMKMYGPDKKVSAVVFTIPNGSGSHAVRVPAKVRECFTALWKDYCQTHSRPREEAKPRIMEQAYRTAWRLAQDWIDVQVSLVVLGQCEALEVFLPYVWDGKETYFESLKRSEFKAISERSQV